MPPRARPPGCDGDSCLRLAPARATRHAPHAAAASPSAARSASPRQTGTFSDDMIPTVGFNMRKVTKGNVTIKLWDLGGQPFRSMWERCCRGVNAIVYVVDAADHDNIEISKSELRDLLSKPTLQGVPLLVLGNKNDLPQALGVDALIDHLELKELKNRGVLLLLSCRTRPTSTSRWNGCGELPPPAADAGQPAPARM